jgi:thiamine-monophosphate kinase
MDEEGRIAWLSRLLGSTGTPGIDLGIGDDAAVLRAPDDGERLVWTIDEQVEGTHFRRDLAPWRDVGFRSFMAAASDVAAMGARPWCALAALVLPPSLSDEEFEDILRGQRAAATEVSAAIVGGNLARGAAVSLSTTLLGHARAPVARRGARPGDGLWLAGRVGLASAGLHALERRRAEPALSAAIEAWLRPRALVTEGLAMAGTAHAAVDISDGLARDAGHVAEASAVCLVLDEAELLADADLPRAAALLALSPLDLALHGGEDYALLASSASPIPGFRRIGEVREGTGLVLRSAAAERPLAARGFDHFSA